MAYCAAWSSKCGDAGLPLSPPAVIAQARTLGPNSTTAMKLLPLSPYHLLVFGYGLAPKEASEPQSEDVNGSGMLGLESSKLGLMSSLIRWKRLMWPQGVSQLPKFTLSRSDAAARDPSSSSRVARPTT